MAQPTRAEQACWSQVVSNTVQYIRLLSALYVLTALRPVVSWTPYEPIRRMGRFSHGTLQTRVCTLKCQMATLHNRFVAER